jgi:hypothetical protein
MWTIATVNMKHLLRPTLGLLLVGLLAPTCVPREEGAQISDFTFGLICSDSLDSPHVCSKTNDIVVTGNGRCVYDRKVVPCTWYGYEFDYHLPKDSITLACRWSSSDRQNIGNPDSIVAENVRDGTYELVLKGRAGHFINPQYRAPERIAGATEVFQVCASGGKDLFAVTYRLRFPGE